MTIILLLILLLVQLNITVDSTWRRQQTCMACAVYSRRRSPSVVRSQRPALCASRWSTGHEATSRGPRRRQLILVCTCSRVYSERIQIFALHAQYRVGLRVTFARCTRTGIISVRSAVADCGRLRNWLMYTRASQIGSSRHCMRTRHAPVNTEAHRAQTL